MLSANEANGMLLLCAVGDLMLGDSPKMLGIGVRNATSENCGEHLFSGVRKTLTADLVFGNLEGALSDSKYDPNNFKKAQLLARPSMAAVLKKVGFNVLNVANNHSMQHGPAVFRETCDRLRENAIEIVGLKGTGKWNSQPVLLKVKGRTIGFLGYADPDNYGYDPLYALKDPVAVLEDVVRLRVDVDFLIVSLHWGDEFVRYPSSACREFGNSLIEAGVDIILGHHPHVVQGVKKYGSGLCCFSLGNFISDMVWNKNAQEGLVTTFDLAGSSAELTHIGHVKINNNYVPTVEPIDLADLAAIVAKDEAAASNETAHHDLIRRRIKENRNLAHWHLLKKFYLYNPAVYAKIWGNSFLSAIKSFA